MMMMIMLIKQKKSSVVDLGGEEEEKHQAEHSGRGPPGSASSRPSSVCEFGGCKLKAVWHLLRCEGARNTALSWARDG